MNENNQQTNSFSQRDDISFKANAKVKSEIEKGIYPLDNSKSLQLKINEIYKKYVKEKICLKYLKKSKISFLILNGFCLLELGLETIGSKLLPLL
jgi:hypothetical protein